jgi:hypothetical protein
VIRHHLPLACLALLACGGQVYFGDAVPFPSGCPSSDWTIDQCAVLVGRAQGELGLEVAEVISIDILTEDRCNADRSVVCNRGGAAVPLSVRFVLADGSSEWTTVYCVSDLAGPGC